MKYLRITALVAGVALLGMLSTLALVEADKGAKSLKADLEGFQEPPAISSTGSGEFRAKISHDETSIEFELSYEGLEGTVQQGHIHLGQRSVNGGISIWLCQTPPAFTDPTGLAPICPQEGTVSGTLTRFNVIGPIGQGIAGTPSGASPEEFAEVVRAIRAGVTYANVHSTKHPGGEIRGQID